jgi:hypothetical protein
MSAALSGKSESDTEASASLADDKRTPFTGTRRRQRHQRVDADEPCLERHHDTFLYCRRCIPSSCALTRKAPRGSTSKQKLGWVDGLGGRKERSIATIRLRFRDRPTRDALQARMFPKFSANLRENRGMEAAHGFGCLAKSLAPSGTEF